MVLVAVMTHRNKAMMTSGVKGVMLLMLCTAGCRKDADHQSDTATQHVGRVVSTVESSEGQTTRPAIVIDNVSVRAQSLNPSAGQTTAIGFRLSERVQLRLCIYGPNCELIRTLINGSERAGGTYWESWDGKDENGRIVADEAYFFVIEATGKTGFGLYDPTTTSGGELVTATQMTVDPKDHSVSYFLPAPARVMVRAGFSDGAMLKTIVNGQRRPRTIHDWYPKDTIQNSVVVSCIEQSVHFSHLQEWIRC